MYTKEMLDEIQFSFDIGSSSALYARSQELVLRVNVCFSRTNLNQNQPIQRTLTHSLCPHSVSTLPTYSCHQFAELDETGPPHLSSCPTFGSPIFIFSFSLLIFFYHVTGLFSSLRLYSYHPSSSTRSTAGWQYAFSN